MFNVVMIATVLLSRIFNTTDHGLLKIPLDPENTIDLGYSRYQGVEIPSAGVKYWLGIRFAAAPLADLRWRAPVDPVVNYTLQDASIVS